MQVKFLELMEPLIHQIKRLVSILVRQTQVYIIMLLIVNSLLIENKSLNLKPTIKTSILQLNFISEVLYKIIFSLIKRVFIVILSFSSFLARIAKVRTKCLSLNDEPCMVRPTVIDLSPIELKHYPLMISLEG